MASGGEEGGGIPRRGNAGKTSLCVSLSEKNKGFNTYSQSGEKTCDDDDGSEMGKLRRNNGINELKVERDGHCRVEQVSRRDPWVSPKSPKDQPGTKRFRWRTYLFISHAQHRADRNTAPLLTSPCSTLNWELL